MGPLRRHFRILFTLPLVVLLSSLAVTAQPNEPVIRVGLTASDSAVSLLYAQKADLFHKYGLNVELVQSGGTTSIAALAGGAIELADSSTLAVVQGFAKGIPFSIVGPLSFYDAKNPNYALLVLANSSLKTAKDFEGKTLASKWLGDMIGLSTIAWLDARHVNVATIAHVEIPPSATLAAMEQGRVDAGVVYEPFYSAFDATGKVRVMGYPLDAIAKRFADTVIVGNTDWVNAHQDAVVRFSRAMRDATAYVVAHENESAELIGNFAHVDPSAYAKNRHSERGSSITPADIQPLIDAAVKYELIPKDFPAQQLICACAAVK
jgi:NitT/TauT family transport system substrate-binding protein